MISWEQFNQLLITIGGLLIPLMTAYIMYIGSKTNKISGDVDKLERNTNSMTKEIANLNRAAGKIEGENIGLAVGEKVAEAMAEGQRKGQLIGANLATSPNSNPIPVIDDKAAEVAKRSADALEQIATTAVENSSLSRKI